MELRKKTTILFSREQHRLLTRLVCLQSAVRDFVDDRANPSSGSPWPFLVAGGRRGNHEAPIGARPFGAAALIFVDTNVFIYSAGAEHPHKHPSRRFIFRVARGEVDAFTSAEVLQEILHRYKAIQRLDEGREIYYLVRKVVRNVTPSPPHSSTSHACYLADMMSCPHATPCTRPPVCRSVLKRFAVTTARSTGSRHSRDGNPLTT